MIKRSEVAEYNAVEEDYDETTESEESGSASGSGYESLKDSKSGNSSITSDTQHFTQHLFHENLYSITV